MGVHGPFTREASLCALETFLARSALVHASHVLILPFVTLVALLARWQVSSVGALAACLARAVLSHRAVWESQSVGQSVGLSGAVSGASGAVSYLSKLEPPRCS